MAEVALYHADLSPCAHKVRLVLEERQIEFESKKIDLIARENLQPEYLAINPKGVVPSLVHGDNIVTESTVINEYLEEVFEQNPLMPSDPMGKARVRLWTKWVDEQLHPNSMPVIFGGLARFPWLAKTEEERNALLAKVPDPVRRARQERLIEHGLEAPDVPPALAVWRQTFEKIEQQLGSTEWLAGDAITIADCSLAVYMFIMKYLQADAVFDNYAALGEWMERMMARPAFDAAIMPYIAKERWELIANVAGNTGPELNQKIFSAA